MTQPLSQAKAGEDISESILVAQASTEKNLSSLNDEPPINDGFTKEDTTITSNAFDENKLAYSTADDGRYQRFSSSRKIAIVSILSYTCILAPFSTTSLIPVMQDVVDALDTTPTLINVTIAVYLIVLGIAPLMWAPLSSTFGRRIIYLISMPLFVAGSLGVGFSNNLAALICTRLIQAIGGSSVIAVSAASIGDIYHPSQRGRALSAMYSTILLGPAFCPLVAGIMGEFIPHHKGWRWVQWMLAIMGAISVMLIAIILPETHPGLKLNEKGNVIRPPISCVVINPLQPLSLLRYPNILAISLTSSAVLSTTYSLQVPIPYTIAPRYHVYNKALVGLLYITCGIGNIVGSVIAGRLADKEVKKWIKKRNGEFIPEDRLRSAVFGAFILFPLPVLGYGLVVQFLKGTAGFVLALVFYFLAGVGMMLVMTVANTYCVDVAPGRSAEVVATNNCLRYICAGGMSAACLPLINAIGIAPTCAITSFLSFMGAGCIVLLILKGRQLRMAVDEKKRSEHITA